MRWSEAGVQPLRCALLLIASGAAAVTAVAAEPSSRYSAPVEIRTPAPFVQLALPPSAYAHVQQPELRDLRVVDGRGERVPYSLLGARSEQQTTEQTRAAALYPLPARPAANGTWPSPVEVVVEGDRIRVRQGAVRGASGSAPAPAARSGGWLIDLGERAPSDPAPQSLRLEWSGPAEFTAGYRVEHSGDLRTWRAGGAGQLMALASAAGPLTQPNIPLPEGTGRFVRLVWTDPAAAPVVTKAQAVSTERRAIDVDPPVALSLAPVAAPTDPATRPEQARGALYFDLGGALPLQKVELRFASGTRVAPVRLQGRSAADRPWRDVAQGVFYRLERDGTVIESPALAVHETTRYLRAVPDERAAPLDAESTRLAVQAPLASLVFATQGQPPYRLLAGSKDAPGGALPAATLVPKLDDERARFGRAELGPWSEVAAVARQLDAEQRAAQWRPLLLWSVLLAGVVGLGVMVWSLVRGTASPAKPPAAPNQADPAGSAPR
jgi:hypothetical protein